MKIILLNIKSFFRNQKLVFIVVLLCVLISSFVLNFSFGLYKNFIVQKNNAIKENKEIAINIANNSELKKGDFEVFFKILIKVLLTILNYVMLNTIQKGLI